MTNIKSSRLFLLSLFILSSLGIYILYEPFLPSVSIAFLLAIATYGINFKFFAYNKFIKPLFITLLLCLLFFSPMIYFISVISPYLVDFDPKDLLENVYLQKDKLLVYIPEFIKPIIIDFLKKLDLNSLASNILIIVTTITKLSTNFVKDIILILIFYFFILFYSVDIIKYIRSVIPMSTANKNILISEIGAVMSTVFYSIIANALFQGILFSIIATFFGYNGFLFGILYSFGSLIPIVGGMLLWLPMSLYELIQGHSLNALIIALYSIILISIVADTFIKPLIIKFISNKLNLKEKILNEFIIFFSIIAGLATFGFWGMIVGPAITAFFASLLKLYQSIKNGKIDI